MAKKPSLRMLALNADQAFRSKKVHVAEWGIDVLIREPSIKARLSCTDLVSGKDGEELTSTQKSLRNIEGDVILFIDILREEDGSPVFTDKDKQALMETYGPVHARLLAEAFSLTISATEAEKK